jgi:Asp-tRNA(Asn)/Glu-tRNA(Gln) amidotransferase A subunit family amidase
LGAVFIAKTNLPQSIMWCETENPLFGLTTNPRDARLTPGGSSGGEGVLLAEKGSVVGWGTDIGGSVRIPAHMLGLYALKPSVCFKAMLDCWHARLTCMTEWSPPL